MPNFDPNDPARNTNQRAPGLSTPGPNAYPYVDFEQTRSGMWWRINNLPENESYAHGHVSGTYHEMSPLSGKTELIVNTHHQYVGAGSTQTSELNHDTKIGGSHVNRVTMDHYGEHAGDMMHAIGQDVIHAVNGIHFHHATGGTQITSSGDHATDHNDGNHHINVAGDHIQYIGGVKYESVGQDKGTYVPNGNFDINVSNNYNVQSSSQITIKVGNSIITILPQSIVVDDGNGNEIGMTKQKMWINNQNCNVPLYLGGNGQNVSLYSLISTISGPSINCFAKYISGNG